MSNPQKVFGWGFLGLGSIVAMARRESGSAIEVRRQAVMQRIG